MASEAPADGGAAAAAESGRERAHRLGLPYLEAGSYPETPWAGAGLSVKFMRRYRCLPLSVEGGRIIRPCARARPSRARAACA